MKAFDHLTNIDRQVEIKNKKKDEGKTEREREARAHARAVECVSAKAVLPRLLAGSKAACNLGWLADCAAG